MTRNKLWCLCALFFLSFFPISTFGQNVIDAYSFDEGFDNWAISTIAGTAPKLWDWVSNGQADAGSLWGNRTAIESPSGGGALVCDPNKLNNSEIEAGNPLQNFEGSVTSPVIDVSNEDTLILKFNQYYRAYQGKSYIDVRDTNDIEWTTYEVNRYVGQNTETTRDNVKYLDITKFAGLSAIQIRFRFQGDMYFWIVDDVQLLDQRPVQTVPPDLSSTLTELNYEFEVDSFGGVYIPNQLVVRYVDTADQNDRDAVREIFNIYKYEHCKCNPQVELWHLGESGNGGLETIENIIDINETGSQAQSTTEVDEVDSNSINNNELIPPSGIAGEPSFDTYQVSDPNDLKIVIMDTGIEYDHLDLKPYIWKMGGYGEICDSIYKPLIGWDFVDNDQFPMDFHSHGTHVAGIVMKHLKKTNCNYKLVPVRTHDENGAGTLFNVTCGFYFSMEIEANYINASFGYYGIESNILKTAINDVLDDGIIVVTAAGNEGYNLDNTFQYPAIYSDNSAFDNIFFTVGSADLATNIRDDFSNFSPTKVDFYAPGENINSTVLNDGWSDKRGTSMAAPYITAALVQVQCSGKTIAEVLGECQTNICSKLEVPVVDIECIKTGQIPPPCGTPGIPWPWIVGAVLVVGLLIFWLRR